MGHFGVLEPLPGFLVVLRDSCGGTCLLRSSTDLRGVILRSFWVKGVPTAFWWSILVLATFHLLPFGVWRIQNVKAAYTDLSYCLSEQSHERLNLVVAIQRY